MKVTDSNLAAMPSASELASDGLSKRLEQLGKSDHPGMTDKAARDFEAYFIQFMLKEMRKTIDRSGLFEGGQARDIFESMFDEAIGKAAASGRGIGLAEYLRDQLGEKEAVPPTPGQSAGAAAPASAGYPSAFALNQYQRALDANRGHLGTITSGFGERIHPITGKEEFHPGIDVAMPEGSSVRAVAPGVVTFAGEKSGYGLAVVVQHPNGYTSLYGHGSEIHVKAGDEVGRGTLLLDSGSTGVSTGPHLHFELRRDGVPVDPARLRWASLP